MKSFVADKTNSSQQQPQHAGQPLNRRQVAAANARVPVPRSNAGQNGQAPAMGGSITRGRSRSEARPGHQTQPDNFAPTETNFSLSAASNQSRVLVEDSQIAAPKAVQDFDQSGQNKGYAQRPQQYEDEAEDSSETQDGERSDESDSSDADGDDQDPTTQNEGPSNQVKQVMHAQHHQQHTVASYPTTTSGGPDNYEEHREDEEYSFQQEHEEEEPQESQHRLHQQFPDRQAERRFNGQQQFSQRQPQIAWAEQPLYQIVGSMTKPPLEMQPKAVSQPISMHQGPQGGRGAPTQHFRQNLPPLTAVHRTASIPQQMQQLPVNTKPRSKTEAMTRAKLTTPGQRNGNGMVVNLPHGQLLEDSLDYNLPELGQMPYEELHDQSFDHDPAFDSATFAESFGFANDEPCKPLSERLDIVRAHPTEHQRAFFESLSLEDWEEAGDWFLEQYGDVIKRMKDLRQAKRKAAKNFEEQVYKRHKQLTKREKVIEASMESMQVDGQKVLRGATPKR